MSMDVDRQAFRDYVTTSEGHVDDGDTEAASAVDAEIEALTKRYQDDGTVDVFLNPLLTESEDPTVRFSAATCLLGAGHTETSLPAVEAIAAGEFGRTSIQAKVLLKSWHRRQDSIDS